MTVELRLSNLASLGGVKPNLGLFVLSFGFFHLCFRHRAPVSPSICLSPQHLADFPKSVQ